VGGFVLFIFGEQFVKLFVSDSDPSVIAYSMKYLTTVSFFFIPLSLIFIYRNALQGMGYTLVPMLAGVCELLARTIVAFTLPVFLGYIGVCLAGPMAWIAACIPLIFDYIKKINNLSESDCVSVNA